MYLTTQQLATQVASTLLTVTNSDPDPIYAGQISFLLTDPASILGVTWLYGTTKLVGFSKTDTEACKLIFDSAKSSVKLVDAPVDSFCGVTNTATLFMEDCADYRQIYRKTGEDTWKLVLSPTQGPLTEFNNLVLQLKQARYTKPGREEVGRLLLEIEKLLRA